MHKIILTIPGKDLTLLTLTRKEFHQFLTHQATVMATEGVNPNTMLYGGKWREAPADDAPVSLTAHLSGCMLMEAMCVLEPME